MPNGSLWKHLSVRVLRWFERFTKTDNIYVVKNGLELFLGSVFSLASSVGLYLLYTRFIPQEAFGTYKYYLSLYALFGLVTFTGIDTALVRSVARHQDGSLVVAFRRKLLGGVVGSFLFLMVSAWYFFHGDQALAIGCVLISLFAPLVYAGNIYSSFLTGKKLFATYRRLSMLLSLMTFIVIASGVLLVRDPVWLLAINLLANSVSLIGYVWSRRYYIESNLKDPELLSYGQHLSAIEIVGTVASQADSLLTFHFLGAVPLAVYSVANLPVDQLKGFLKIGQSIAFPKFANQDKRHVGSLLWKVFLLMGVTAVCCLFYALLIPWVFHWLIPRYESSIVYTQALVFSLVFAMPAALIVTYLYAQAARKEITLYNLTNYISLIVFNVLGILYFGLWGIVYAAYLNRGLMLVLAIWRVTRYGRTKPDTLLA